MANIKSQKKRIITNEKSRVRNRAIKSELKTATARVKAAVEAKDGALAYSEALATCRLMDKAVAKGAIHKNQAANRKAGIMAIVADVVTDADRAAYEKAAPAPQVKKGSKKAAAKAARKEAMEQKNAEKAARVKEHEKAVKEAAKKAAEAPAEEAAEEE